MWLFKRTSEQPNHEQPMSHCILKDNERDKRKMERSESDHDVWLFSERLRLRWYEWARTRRRVVERPASLPSDRRPTDQPGGGAEALGMSVVSEPPRGWDASPSVSRVSSPLDLVYHFLLYLILPPIDRQSSIHANSHSWRYTRFFTIVIATTTAAVTVPEVVKYTWIVLCRAYLESSQWQSNNRAAVIAIENRFL